MMTKARRERGRSLGSAADIAGVGQTTLLRWEAGAEPKRAYDRYIRYCARLGIVRGPHRHYKLVADAIDSRDFSPWRPW